MRTYEFTCAGCGRTVKESVQSFDASPEYCQTCLLEIQTRTDAKPGDARPSTPFRRNPDPQPGSVPSSGPPPAPPKPPAAKPPRRSGTSITIRLKPSCRTCKGRGKVKGALCPTCNGSGVQPD